MSRVDPKLQLAGLLAAFFVLWTIRATWLIQVDQSIPSPESRMVFSSSVKALFWMVPAALFGHWARKENPFRYLGLSAVPRLRISMLCLLAILIFYALVLLFEGLLGQKQLSFQALSLTGFPSDIAFFIVSPFVEEIFFRGLVLKEMNRFMGTALSNFITSVLFVGIHLPYWISSGVQALDGARMAVGILLFSLFAGWLYFLSKSIWPPTAAHIANNIVSTWINIGK